MENYQNYSQMSKNYVLQKQQDCKLRYNESSEYDQYWFDKLTHSNPIIQRILQGIKLKDIQQYSFEQISTLMKENYEFLQFQQDILPNYWYIGQGNSYSSTSKLVIFILNGLEDSQFPVTLQGKQVSQKKEEINQFLQFQMMQSFYETVLVGTQKLENSEILIQNYPNSRNSIVGLKFQNEQYNDEVIEMIEQFQKQSNLPFQFECCSFDLQRYINLEQIFYNYTSVELCFCQKVNNLCDLKFEKCHLDYQQPESTFVQGDEISNSGILSKSKQSFYEQKFFPMREKKLTDKISFLQVSFLSVKTLRKIQGLGIHDQRIFDKINGAHKKFLEEVQIIEKNQQKLYTYEKFCDVHEQMQDILNMYPQFTKQYMKLIKCNRLYEECQVVAFQLQPFQDSELKHQRKKLGVLISDKQINYRFQLYQLQKFIQIALKEHQEFYQQYVFYDFSYYEDSDILLVAIQFKQRVNFKEIQDIIYQQKDDTLTQLDEDKDNIINITLLSLDKDTILLNNFPFTEDEVEENKSKLFIEYPSDLKYLLQPWNKSKLEMQDNMRGLLSSSNSSSAILKNKKKNLKGKKKIQQQSQLKMIQIKKVFSSLCESNEEYFERLRAQSSFRIQQSFSNIEEQSLYEVEKILKKKIRFDRDRRVIEELYLVKWKGYDYSQCTWEPYDNMKNIYSEYFVDVDSKFIDNMEVLKELVIDMKHIQTKK